MTIVPTSGSVSGGDSNVMLIQLAQEVAALQRYMQFNNAADTGWQTITTFYNSFVGGTGNGAPQVRSIGSIVFARGYVSGGVAGDAAFYLPASLQPSAEIVLAVQEYGVSADSWLTVSGSGDSTPGAVAPATGAAWLCCSWLLG